MSKIERCRLCSSTNFEVFLKLGTMPLAGDFLEKKNIGKEKSYPLDILFCNVCYSVQVSEVIPRDTFFRDYRYLSSVASKSVHEHFQNYAHEIKERFLPNGGFVVEVACNDGILLEPLKNLGLKTLGVDPAINVVKIGREKGLEIIDDYFELEQAIRIKKKFGNPNVIIGNAVFAHVENLDDISLGVKHLLHKDGVFIFEVNYLGDMIDELQYDVIYHEHTMYHSVLTLNKFLKKHNMKIFDVKHLDIRGGTIRVYSSFEDSNFSISVGVKEIIDSELTKKYDDIETYHNFARRCENHKLQILTLLNELKNSGKKIIGYGMSGRGNTMLNYWNVDSSIIDYGIDASPERYGRFVPGMHIPIIPPPKFIDSDYVLLLAWIFANDIMEKENDFIKNGGKFIIPFPEPHVLPH